MDKKAEKKLVSEPAKTKKKNNKFEKIIEQKWEHMKLLCAIVNKNKGRALKYSEEEGKLINKKIEEIKIIESLINL